MVDILKPKQTDILQVREILAFWTDKEGVEKYIQRIKDEINGKIQFNLRFWIAKEGSTVLGVIGLSDPLPEILSYAKSKKPGELKILYVSNKSRGKGVGRLLIQFLEKEAKKQDYKELLVRSARKYKDTAYGFYKKMGYSDLGTIINKSGNPMQLFGKLLE